LGQDPGSLEPQLPLAIGVVGEQEVRTAVLPAPSATRAGDVRPVGAKRVQHLPQNGEVEQPAACVRVGRHQAQGELV
jgi:hypothetical protein